MFVAPPNFPQENLDQHLDEFVPGIPGHVDIPDLDTGTSTLQHKRWAKTIGDLLDNELIEGKSTRSERK